MVERKAHLEPDVGAVEALVRGAASGDHAAAVFLLAARRPARLGELPDQADRRTGTPGDAVRSAFDDLTWEEAAEVRDLIDTVLEEARAEGKLPARPPHDRQMVTAVSSPTNSVLPTRGRRW